MKNFDIKEFINEGIITSEMVHTLPPSVISRILEIEGVDTDSVNIEEVIKDALGGEE